MLLNSKICQCKEIGQYVNIIARVVLIRQMGAIIFSNIYQENGKIQVLARKGSNCFDIYKNVKVGDILYVSGRLMLTNTKELTIEAENVIILISSVVAFLSNSNIL